MVIKIPFTNIKIGNVTDKDVNRPTGADILKKIQITQLTRVKEDVNRWRTALNQAESKLSPDRTDLVRVFQDITLDAHLTSLLNTVRLKVLASAFYIENESGDIDDVLTERFRKAWFRDLVSHAVDADFYGASLVQLGSIKDDVFTSSTLIPREYVIPERRAVKKNMRITQADLLFFDELPWSNWVIFIEKPGNLGLLTKAAPLVIWKKNVLGAWSEAAELFGMPVRMGKTDINNPKAYSNMVSMLENMGSAAYGVFDNDDELQYIEITKSDYFQVYDKLVERVNSELSKLILGQTMTSDNGSSRSQAEVHERVLDDYISGVKRTIGDVVNDQLLPLMRVHGIFPKGYRFKWDDELKVSLEVRFKWVVELLGTKQFEIAADWIEQTFGIPVEEKPEPVLQPGLDGPPQPPGSPGGGSGGGGSQGSDTPNDQGDKTKKIVSVMPGVCELYNEAAHSHAH
jgi:phage gp29-like protein